MPGERTEEATPKKRQDVRRRQRQRAQRARGKQHPAHQVQVVREEYAGKAEREPQQDHAQDQLQGGAASQHYLTFIPGCAPLSGASR